MAGTFMTRVVSHRSDLRSGIVRTCLPAIAGMVICLAFCTASNAQLAQIALSNALDDVSLSLEGKCYPVWTNKAPVFARDSMASFDGQYAASNKVADILGYGMSNYIPRTLWNDAVAAASNCYWKTLVMTNGSVITTNRIAYVVVNCSGLLDANVVGGAPRSFSSTNVNEINLASLPDVIDANLFLADRSLQAPYTTILNLETNRGVIFPVHNFYCHSYDPGRDMMFTNICTVGQRSVNLYPKFKINDITNTPEYKLYETGALNQEVYHKLSVPGENNNAYAMDWSNAAFVAYYNQARAQLPAGIPSTDFSNYYGNLMACLQGQGNFPLSASGTATPLYSHPDKWKDIAANIINYLDKDRIPQIIVTYSRPYAWQVSEGYEDTPLINEVVLLGTEAAYQFNVELWFPFWPGTVTAADGFSIDVNVYTNAASVEGPDLPPGVAGWSLNTPITDMKYDPSDPTKQFFIAKSGVISFPGGAAIGTTNGTGGTNAVYFAAMVKKTENGKTYNIDQAMTRAGQGAMLFTNTVGYSVKDPRANGQRKYWVDLTWDAARGLWISYGGKGPYDSGTATLGQMNVNCNVWDAKACGLPIFHRNGPMETIGELGHIGVGNLDDELQLVYGFGARSDEWFWQTINILSWNYGSFLLDRMTVRATNMTTRGLVSISTAQTNVLLTLFDGMGIGMTNSAGQYQQVLHATDPAVQQLVATIIAKGPSSSFQSMFTNTPDWWGDEMGVAFRACADVNACGNGVRASDMAWKDAMLKIAELITFRQNEFTILIAGQQLSPEDGSLLVEERAVANVWRDTYTGTNDTSYFSCNFVWRTNTIFVSKNGHHQKPFVSWTCAATNITEAAVLVRDGDIVTVSNGTYEVTDQIRLTNAATMRSVGGPDVTTVDGLTTTRCFYVSHSNAVVDGFTITHGRSVDGNGNGVYCANEGTVKNCRIKENCGRNDGGGAYLTYTGVMENCEILNNQAGNKGGGVACFGGALVRNCLIAGNQAFVTDVPKGAGLSGGGVFCQDGDISIQNCTIVGNSAPGWCGGISMYSGNIELCNSIVFSNEGTNYDSVPQGTRAYSFSCTSPGLPGEGDTSNLSLIHI